MKYLKYLLLGIAFIAITLILYVYLQALSSEPHQPHPWKIPRQAQDNKKNEEDPELILPLMEEVDLYAESFKTEQELFQLRKTQYVENINPQIIRLFNPVTLHVHLDKAIYRPNQIVFIQVFFVDPINNSFVNCSQMYGQIKLSIKDGIEQEVFSSSQFLSENCKNSAVVFTYSIPEDISGGVYTIEITNSQFFSKGIRTFRIRDYNKPTMNVQVDFNRDVYYPLNTMYAKITAKKLDGSYISKGTLSYSCSFGRNSSSLVSTSFDENGVGYISCEIPNIVGTTGAVSLLITPEYGEEFTKLYPIPISDRNIFIDFVPETGYLVGNVLNNIYFYAHGKNFEAAQFEGHLIEEDFSNKNRTILKEVKTIHQGKGKFSFVPKIGKYKYFIEVDFDGNYTQKIMLPPIDDSASFNFILSHSILEDGNSINLTIQKNKMILNSSGSILISRKEQVFKKIDFQIIQPNVEASFLINSSDLNISGIYIVSLVRNMSAAESEQDAKKLYRHELLGETLIFRKPSKTIDIELDMKTSYTVRDNVTGSVSISIDKFPINGFINAYIVDITSTLELEKKKRPPSLPTMIQLENEIYKNNSELELYFASEYIDPWFHSSPKKQAELEKNREKLELLLGIQNWRKFLFWNPVMLKKFIYSEDNSLFAQQVSNLLSYQEPVYEEMLEFDFDDEEALPMMAQAENEDGGRGIDVKANEVGKQAQQIHKKYDNNPSNDTIIRNGYMVITQDNQRNYAHYILANMGQNREDFTETLFVGTALAPVNSSAFLINSLIDEIKIEFELCDTIGEFEITIEAFTLDGEFGMLKKSFYTTKEFYLNFESPKTLLRGDILNLNTYFYNNYNDALNVNYSLLENNHLVGDFGTRVIDFSDPSLHSPIEIQMRKTGKTTIQVEATAITNSGKTFRDSMSQQILIEPEGFPNIISKSGSIGSNKFNSSKSNRVIFNQTIPSFALNETSELRVQLFPTPVASLIEAMEKLIREPYGCFEQTSSTTYPLVMALIYLKSHLQTQKSIEMIMDGEEKLKKGYQKLLSFEASSGGYEWFGDNPGHESLTSYGLMQFAEMAQVFPVDKSMIKRVSDWILAKKLGNGTFSLSSRALDSFGRAPLNLTTAYVVWALSSMGIEESELKNELSFLFQLAEQTTDSYILSLICLSAINYQMKEKVEKISSKIVEKQLQTGEWVDAETSITSSARHNLIMETTALAIMALIGNEKINKKGVHLMAMQNAMDFIIKNVKEGKYGSTQSTILCLKAIIEFEKFRGSVNGKATIVLAFNNNIIGKREINSSTQAIIDFANILKNSTITDSLLPSKEFQLSLSIEDYIPDSQVTEDFSIPYLMELVYYSIDIQASNNDTSDVTLELRSNISESENIQIGSICHFVGVIRNLKNKTLGMTVAIIRVPAGLEIEFSLLERLKTDKIVDHFEVPHSNEVVLYWKNMDPLRELDFELQFIAKFEGNFQAKKSTSYNYYIDDLKSWVQVEPIMIRNE